MIHFVLVPNRMSGSEQCVAQVQPTDTVDQDFLIDEMIARGFPMEHADVAKVIDAYYATVIRTVLDGKNVVTPWGGFRVAIRGRFDGMADGFDSARHQVVLRATTGKLPRRMVREQVQLVKEETVERRPSLLEYNDTLSATRNQVLTPGGPSQIIGRRLHFDPADPQQGIFFVDANGVAKRAEVIVKNMPGEVIVVAPALTPGEYTLEARVIFEGSEEVRTGELKTPLIVS